MEHNWNQFGFSPADILLPRDVQMEKWSVVACDQFTSEPEYWDEAERFVGEEPSTLKLIFPESRLGEEHPERRIDAINQTMREYLQSGLFRTLSDSLILVERRQSNGKVRYGLVGKLDLERYSYERGADSLVRATEGTILSRIPPRVRIRENAPLELPHVMVLVDDEDDLLLGPLKEHSGGWEVLYDFDLMQGGGRITGFRVESNVYPQVAATLDTLFEKGKKLSNGGDPFLFAVGDGNHSLAAAKESYERRKKTLPPEEWDSMPDRYALVELVNLHDPALEFEPIHRVLFGVDPEKVLAFLRACPEVSGTGEGKVTCVLSGRDEKLDFSGEGLPVGLLQNRLDEYLDSAGGEVDYIHGEEAVRTLAQRQDAIGFLLPVMEKSELFVSVAREGALPRKTFSMGEASDKRYYLECRGLR